MRFLLVLAFGLQSVAGQLCGIQADCSSCLSVAGCVWNANACWSSSSNPFCANDVNCIAIKARCPLMAAPTFYSQPVSTTLYAGTVLPPAYASASVGTVLPSYPTYPTTSFATMYPTTTYPTYPTTTFATTYPTTTLATTYPVATALPAAYSVTTALPAAYPVTTSFATTYPMASASLYARPSVVSTPLYSSTILPSASFSAYPSASFSTYPSASFSTYGSVLPSAPLYSSAPVYPSVGLSASAYPVYGGLYAGSRRVNANVGVNANAGLFGGNGQLFNYQGSPLSANIRNNFYANALAPIIPGIGGAVSTANNLNLLTNSPQIVGNVIGGQGYRRDPFGAYIRNDLYANALGDVIPGLGGSLSAFNELNLYSSLLG